MVQKRTYGRGAGEREYTPIPLFKNRRRVPSRLFESGHAKYPVSGIYGPPEPKQETSDT